MAEPQNPLESGVLDDKLKAVQAELKKAETENLLKLKEEIENNLSEIQGELEKAKPETLIKQKRNAPYSREGGLPIKIWELKPGDVYNEMIRRVEQSPNKIAFLKEEIELLEKEKQNQLSMEQGEHISFHDIPNLPIEFGIAVKCWLNLVSKGLSKNKSPKEQISDWVKQNYPTCSKDATYRIATILNPNKEGGAPKTPDLK